MDGTVSTVCPPLRRCESTKAGYEPAVQRLSLSDHQTQNFTLALTAARVNLAGTYTLTISAPAECLDKLPQEVWTRRYTATVTQSGPVLDVSLSGAAFVLDDSGKGDGFEDGLNRAGSSSRSLIPIFTTTGRSRTSWKRSALPCTSAFTDRSPRP